MSILNGESTNLFFLSLCDLIIKFSAITSKVVVLIIMIIRATFQYKHITKGIHFSLQKTLLLCLEMHISSVLSAE